MNDPTRGCHFEHICQPLDSEDSRKLRKMGKCQQEEMGHSLSGDMTCVVWYHYSVFEAFVDRFNQPCLSVQDIGYE